MRLKYTKNIVNALQKWYAGSNVLEMVLFNEE